jgi:2-polyprenyl-6-methoxyphenol hydroxylase-like FAD-dependent oxidoreductase
MSTIQLNDERQWNTAMSLRVVIAGGGLGGLALAHRLRQAGLQPLVFERGPAHLDLASSYRIHIDANGSRALRACLPDHLWNRFEQRSAVAPRGIAFATERLVHLAVIPDRDPGVGPSAVSMHHSHPISRSGLRQLLLSGLEDVVHFDTRVVGYDQPSTGGVHVHLADDSHVVADVLVGADGSASTVRKRLLPDARVIDTGVVGIAGKVFLDPARREHLGRRFLGQMTMVLPPHDTAMFIAPFVRPGPSVADDPADLPDHLFWVLLARAEVLGLQPGAHRHDGEELRRRARGCVERWHPLLPALVEASEPGSIIGVPLHTSVRVPSWCPSRVTLLGDAIHTMTPLQGLGGNTAFVDAAILGHNLVEAATCGGDLVGAIGVYEAAMRDYGFDAVQRSLQVSSAVTSTSVFGRWAFRNVLRVANRQPWLHGQLFANRDLAAERLRIIFPSEGVASERQAGTRRAG